MFTLIWCNKKNTLLLSIVEEALFIWNLTLRKIDEPQIWEQNQQNSMVLTFKIIRHEKQILDDSVGYKSLNGHHNKYIINLHCILDEIETVIQIYWATEKTWTWIDYGWYFKIIVNCLMLIVKWCWSYIRRSLCLRETYWSMLYL